MALKLMYITNSVQIAKIAEKAGVDRIFVDMEYIGKSTRQQGMDTVQSHHTIEDIVSIKEAINTAELIVRVNPIHEASEEYASSKEEIEATIKAGADIIMLPYFKTLNEVKEFIKIIDGRVKTILLIETPEAVDMIDDILELHGVDEVFIGLNDLSLGYGKKFMFELLVDGTVESLCLKFKQKNIPYGFGGIAALGQGMVPAENVIIEHYRMGSTCAILARSFCNTTHITDTEQIRSIFVNGIMEIRKFEQVCQQYSSYFTTNTRVIRTIVDKILDSE